MKKQSRYCDTINSNDEHQTAASVRHVIRSPLSQLIASLAAFCLLCGSGNVAQDKIYDCAGKNDNGMVSFREFPTIHFSDRRMMVAGSNVFSTFNYEICAETDTSISFATSREVCRSGAGEITSLNSSNGSFDKVSGRLEIKGAQGLYGDYQCKASYRKP